MKGLYHNKVLQQKEAAILDSELLADIEHGHNRSGKYKESWQKININDFINRFTPDPTMEIDGNKMMWTGSDGKYRITADIGGGYCRLEDYQYFLRTKNHLYFDINGKDVRNYKDERGKQHGRPSKEQEALTHFKILHREEM